MNLLEQGRLAEAYKLVHEVPDDAPEDDAPEGFQQLVSMFGNVMMGLLLKT